MTHISAMCQVFAGENDTQVGSQSFAPIARLQQVVKLISSVLGLWRG